MIVVFLTGILLLFIGLRPFLVILSMLPLKKTSIETLEVLITQKSEARLYVYIDVFEVSATYSYIVENQCYTSDKIYISNKLKFENQQMAEIFKNKILERNECYYSKHNPNNAILTRSISIGDGDSTYALLASGLICIAIYFYLSGLMAP